MDRYTRDQLSAAIAATIRSVWPDSRAKRLARALGISERHAKRVICTGHIGSRMRRALVDLLDREIQDNELRLRQLRRQLQEIDHETVQDMAGRTAADGMGTVPPEGEGPC